MFSQIEKRDGRLVKFEAEKITNAIAKAGQATGEFNREVAKKFTIKVLNLAEQLFKDKIPTVEEIQDIVEEVLLSSPYRRTAKAYIIYREQHARIREIAARAGVDLVDQYLKQLDWQVNENSNMAFSLQGLNNYISSEISKIYWLNKIYPPEIRERHLSGDFHIHDLNILSVYCVGWDLYDLLLEGFKGAPGKVESKPARHFHSALGQIVNLFYTLQGESAGAQAFANFDTLLAPFIRYDGLRYKEVKQALQEFVFNINVPTRVGFQSLSYDEVVIYKKNNIIYFDHIGKLVEKEFGKKRDKIIHNFDGYGNFSKDSLAVGVEGDGYEVLGFDKDSKIRWLKVKSLIKHRVSKKVFKRIRTGNAEIKVSPAHSLFRLNNERIEPIQPDKLSTIGSNEKPSLNTHVLAVGSLDQSIVDNLTELDMVEILSELPEGVQDKFYIRLKEEDLRVFVNKLKLLFESGKEILYNYGNLDSDSFLMNLEKDIVPFRLYVDYADELSKDLIVYINPYSNRGRFISGEELKAFIKLTAHFIADGETSGVAVERSKGFAQMVDDTNASAYNSGIYAYILPYLCGASPHEKRIPFYVFKLNSELRRYFISELLKKDEDGEASNRIVFSSVSDRLLSGLSFLCLLEGWRVSMLKREEEGRAGTIMVYEHPAEMPEIRKGDVIGTPVYSIEDIAYNHDWEYDISVDAETENFVGGQGLIIYHNTPFTNVTLDLKVPAHLADQPVICGGEPKKETYKEFSEEMRLFNRAFLEVMLEGDAKGRVFTFPIPTYNITKDFCWEDRDLQLLWEVAAKYGIPYFSNFINSDMNPEDARSMCCRLRLDTRRLERRGGGLFGANPLTGSIGVVTINMPKLGWLAKDEAEFFERLDKLMTLAKESLEIKRKVLEGFTESDLYPYTKYYLRGIKKRFGEYWKNHFSTIGLIGMNEACLNFFGEDITSDRSKAFALRVLDFMRDKLLKFQEETGNNYNLEATPAEGASYRLAMLDKAQFPGIISANEEGPPFYTNSTQLPVGFTGDLFEALDHQDEFQVRYTGGTVFHIFLGERVEEGEAVKNLIKKICYNYRLPYFTFTPTFSICSTHGYLAGEHEECPKCGEKCEVYSRVVGYLRPVVQWNRGKQEEFRLRRPFVM